MQEQDHSTVIVPEKDKASAELASDSKEGKEQNGKYKSQPQENASVADYVRIFSYATRGDIVILCMASLASIGAGITMPLMFIVFGNLVGSFTSYSKPGSAVPENDFTSSIDRQTLYLVYLFIGKFVCCYVAMFSFRIIGIRISAAIRLAYLQALFSQPISALDKLPSGQASSAITTAANTLQLGISEKLSTCLQFMALLVSAYVIAFKYSWQLTLAASSIVLFVLVVFSALVPVSVKFQKSVDHANEKASSVASEVFSSIRMVMACGAEKRVAATFSKWVEEARRRGLKLAPVLGLQFSPIFFSIYADFALTFWFGIKLYTEDHLESVVTVLIVLMSVMMSVMSLGNIIAPVIDAGRAASAASTFFAVIDAPRINQQGLKDPDVSAEDDIMFKGVTFAYPSRPHVKVMDNFNACFEKGKLTAIVGPSGSGKSTVVGLIERWYELPGEGSPGSGDKEKKGEKENETTPITLSGEVTMGKHNLQDLDLKWWRSQIGLVQQEPFLFNDTIFKNVSYGLVGSRFENEPLERKRILVEEACREAFADEFIDKLPLGYETQVGDSGIKLSGGQRQRLAIARSIIKRPAILIFDEATSAIDVRGERIVQEALDRVAKNHTTITIAHRLSTIKKADKIIVVSKGTVVEQGTHEGLLSNPDGVYFNLVNAQNLTLGEDQDLVLTKTLSPHTINDTTTDGKETENTSTTEQSYKVRGFFRSFGLLLIEQKSHLIWLALTLLGAMGSAASFPAQAFLFAKLVNVFNEKGQKLTDDASYWSLMFVALACSLAVTYGLVGWASSTLSTHASCNYRQEYFENITAKPMSFFDAEDNSSGTLTSRVATDPTQIQELLGVNMAMVLIAGFSVVACVSISYAFGWKLTLVAMFANLPIIGVASFNRLRFEVQFEKLNALVFEESSKFAGEAFGAVRTVTALTLEDIICDRYASLLKGHVDAANKKARFATLIFALSDSVNLLCVALTFWYGGRLLGSREYDVTQFLVVYIAIIQGSESAGQWCSFAPNMAQVTNASNRILSLRDRGSYTKKASLTNLAGGDSIGGAEISFHDVHFKYPTRDISIFAGLNLNIKKGQFAGLVGASGCGKTTVISLLERFYQAQKGRICLDGVDINNINVSEYRKAFSLVAQEPNLFQGTIRENILLAVDENSVTDEDMLQACRDAEIHDFITSLPEGYNTDIGSRGVALSGGQKQRIAIARALIRNPRVLLLDEATSSLDSESEKLVQTAFERAGNGRTMVVVAHRLATVQNADVIFVLGGSGEGARVLEKGTHSELVAKRGIYFQLCQSQALDR